MSTASQFDQHADTYDADLNQALSVSGEDKDYFAGGRVVWLRQCLQRLRLEPHSAIDYGCGIGDTSILLRDVLKLDLVSGLDVSVRSLELATLHHSSSQCRFLTFDQYVPQAEVDMVYCNGVFHHIAVEERAAAVDYIHRSLRSGGLFALWENNPWNPGTRYVMSKCAFDHDAIRLSAREAMRLVRERNFKVVGVDYLFFFPRLLKALRFTEPLLTAIPLGAQYQILCRKP
jgi:SAM-dependent methyltransferase